MAFSFICSVLGLGSQIEIQIDEFGAESLKISISEGGDVQVLNLHRTSVRAPGFRLIVQTEDGEYLDVDPGPARTYEGTFLDRRGVQAVGSFLDGELHALIQWPDGRRFFLEPSRDRQFASGNEPYQWMNAFDMDSSSGTCAMLDSAMDPLVLDPPPSAVVDDVLIAEIAFDVDYEMYLHLGDVMTAANHVEAVLQAVNVLYERELGIRHVITAILVRTTRLDPYTTSHPESLLRQFAQQWSDHHGDIRRDAAQLFTGRRLDGGTIGVGWRYGICTTSGYSVVAPDCCEHLGCRTDLSAHELGHNWGAGHCGCPQTTMNPTLTCANRFDSAQSIPDILGFRATRPCLYAGPRVLRVLIDGPVAVAERTSADYRAVAYFSDGRSREVTSSSVWNVEPNRLARNDGPGRFTMSDVEVDEAVTVSVVYRDETGTVTHSTGITIVDRDEPDARSIEITVVPDLDPQALEPGQAFEAVVFLSSPEGEIKDLRRLQLDTGLSAGVSVRQAVWDVEGLADASGYAWNSNLPVIEAHYEWGVSLPGWIVHLSPRPLRVARLSVVFQEDGALNLLGLSDSADSAGGARFLAGFYLPREFDQSEGNLFGGGLVLRARRIPPRVLSAEPPNGSVDARGLTSGEQGSSTGWRSLVLHFSDDVEHLEVGDFTIFEQGGSPPPQAIEELVLLDSTSVQLVFTEPIEIGAWIHFTHEPSGSTFRLAHIPGDVDASGTCTAADVNSLLSALESRAVRPLWSTDINGSGQLEPTDLMHLVNELTRDPGGSRTAWRGP